MEDDASFAQRRPFASVQSKSAVRRGRKLVIVGILSLLLVFFYASGWSGGQPGGIRAFTRPQRRHSPPVLAEPRAERQPLESSSNSSTLFFPLTVERTAENRREVALVVIIYNNRSAADYVLPHSTLGCYARMFDYPLIEINLEHEKRYLDECAGTDFMFQRHCVMARLMEERPQIEWFAFLDADMGVVNPNHLLEEFTDDRADLIFYDRLYNYEIMAGAYLARNTPFARSFLRHWAAYEFRVAAGTLHGTDNGAISEVFLDHFCADCAPDRRRRCATIWRNSHTFDDLFRYESCAREILGPAEWLRSLNGTVRQLAVGRGYWVRDGWQTSSRWSDDDFIKRNGEWRSMFASERFPAVRCADRRSAHSLWAYRPEFRATNAEIREKLEEIARRTYAGHLDRLQEVNKLPI